jgi:hypothetical protein
MKTFETLEIDLWLLLDDLVCVLPINAIEDIQEFVPNVGHNLPHHAEIVEQEGPLVGSWSDVH